MEESICVRGSVGSSGGKARCVWEFDSGEDGERRGEFLQVGGLLLGEGKMSASLEFRRGGMMGERDGGGVEGHG